MEQSAEQENYAYDGSMQKLLTKEGFTKSLRWGIVLPKPLSAEDAQDLCTKPAMIRMIFTAIEYSGTEQYKDTPLADIPALKLGDKILARQPDLEPGEPSEYTVSERSIKPNGAVRLTITQTHASETSAFKKNELTLEYAQNQASQWTLSVYMHQLPKSDVPDDIPNTVLGKQALNKRVVRFAHDPQKFRQDQNFILGLKIEKEIAQQFGLGQSQGFPDSMRTTVPVNITANAAFATLTNYKSLKMLFAGFKGEATDRKLKVGDTFKYHFDNKLMEFQTVTFVVKELDEQNHRLIIECKEKVVNFQKLTYTYQVSPDQDNTAKIQLEIGISRDWKIAIGKFASKATNKIPDTAIVLGISLRSMLQTAMRHCLDTIEQANPKAREQRLTQANFGVASHFQPAQETKEEEKTKEEEEALTMN